MKRLTSNSFWIFSGLVAVLSASSLSQVFRVISFLSYTTVANLHPPNPWFGLAVRRSPAPGWSGQQSRR